MTLAQQIAPARDGLPNKVDGGLNSLGFAKAPADTRIVVAMSGGVDSSTVAAMLAAEGYEVIGITLQLYDHGAAVAKKGACCAGDDIHDARRVSERLGIAHYVLDYESRFRQDVMEPFAEAYARGETPIPCIACNRTVKFRDLLAAARDLGADALATGHYVQRRDGGDGAELHMAADPARDQSYFLYATTREQLDFLRFPLGGLASKAETRALAVSHGLAVADKPDSQDICFVPNGSYAAVVQKLRPEAGEPGEVVHLDGRVLGRHDGILHFTVGQRRGLGIGDAETGGEPLYVVRLDPETRRVVVGPEAALGRTRIQLRDLNWLAGPNLADDLPVVGLAVQVKIRSTRPPASATLFLRGGVMEVVLDLPEKAVAPGQACVIYDGTRVLGGGMIARETTVR